MARFYLLTAVIFWGWTFVATRIVLDYMTPVELLGLRFLIGIPVLLIVVAAKRLRFRVNRRERWMLLVGSAIITIHFLIQITGLKYTTATNTGWIISITPLILAVLAWAVLKERIGRKEITGIIVATLGILLLVSNGRFTELNWLESVGDWLVLASAHTWAFYTIATRDVSRSQNPLTVTCAVLIPGAAVVLGYMIFTSDWSRFLNLPLEPTLALLFLAILGLAVAHWFWQEGIAAIGGARAGIFLYLEPIATTALAVPYLGEPFTPYTAVGGGLVLLGVYVAQRRSKRKGPASTAQADSRY